MTVHTYKDSHSQIRIPIGIGLGVVLIGVVTGVLYLRARSEINQVALSAQPKGVSTVMAQASQYRPSRRSDVGAAGRGLCLSQ